MFMDVMLDLAVMREADHGRRRQIIRERLIDEIPAVVGKYKIEGFNIARFVDDLRTWLDGAGGTSAVPPQGEVALQRDRLGRARAPHVPFPFGLPGSFDSGTAGRTKTCRHLVVRSYPSFDVS